MSERSLEVTFCAVQRVNGRSYLLLCTRAATWRLYRLDGFSAARESCKPIEVRLLRCQRGLLHGKRRGTLVKALGN